MSCGSWRGGQVQGAFLDLWTVCSVVPPTHSTGQKAGCPGAGVLHRLTARAVLLGLGLCLVVASILSILLISLLLFEHLQVLTGQNLLW